MNKNRWNLHFRFHHSLSPKSHTKRIWAKSITQWWKRNSVSLIFAPIFLPEKLFAQVHFQFERINRLEGIQRGLNQAVLPSILIQMKTSTNESFFLRNTKSKFISIIQLGLIPRITRNFDDVFSSINLLQTLKSITKRYCVFKIVFNRIKQLQHLLICSRGVVIALFFLKNGIRLTNWFLLLIIGRLKMIQNHLFQNYEKQ